MAPFASGLIRYGVIATLGIAILVACGSSSNSEFDNGGGKGDGGDEGNTGGFNVPDSGGGSNVCKPKTCAEQGIECGPAGDGCSGLIASCGTCANGQRCGGPGKPSKCVDPNQAVQCTPKTCADLGFECGPAGDGCGGIIQCGTCPPGPNGQTTQCGAIGKPSKCVLTGQIGPDGGACVPKVCADFPAGT